MDIETKKELIDILRKYLKHNDNDYFLTISFNPLDLKDLKSLDIYTPKCKKQVIRAVIKGVKSIEVS